jgi:hypothetical protein
MVTSQEYLPASESRREENERVLELVPTEVVSSVLFLLIHR